MKKVFLFLSIYLVGCTLLAQSVSQKLQTAFAKFEKDDQLQFAISSLYVIDATTGQVVFDKNSRVGLTPASTQKIITSVTAYELLGKDYRFKTELAYDGAIKNSVLNGNLYVLGSGDPTLGSFRWAETNPEQTLLKWSNEVKKTGIKSIDGIIKTNTSHFSYQSIPDGWIWQDIGNYYGAGSFSLNWQENQYELVLNAAPQIGGKVQLRYNGYTKDDWVNELQTAGKGTGDNAYIYFDDYINGTVPIGAKSFKISAASPDPVSSLLINFDTQLHSQQITTQPPAQGYQRAFFIGEKEELTNLHGFYTHYSPPLDSIIFWFNKKSINLYGEALVKAFALEKNHFAKTTDGITLIKDFWKQKGIDIRELGIEDGSGLSPQNRVTTHAQVEVLKYAKTRNWFPGFYNSLPLYNEMKMKSGTISGAKGFTGYHKSKTGKEYIFSFLVNNFNSSASALIIKMYQVLNALK